MSFYQSITDHYHHIFPLNKIQIDFVKSSFNETKNLKLLDIGCGVGELSFEISKHFNSVEAIDLDKSMVNRARHSFEGKADNLHFKNMNMLNLENVFGKNAFDAVVCFGNTLVHLDGPDEVDDFFKQTKQVLKKNGKFLFQVINYDRIIDQGIKGLPTIENDNIQFVRNYHYRAEQNRIDFETILIIKKTGKSISNNIPLFPIRKNKIAALLNQAGFDDIQFYGNFKKEILTNESIPLVVKAS